MARSWQNRDLLDSCLSRKYLPMVIMPLDAIFSANKQYIHLWLVVLVRNPVLFAMALLLGHTAPVVWSQKMKALVALYSQFSSALYTLLCSSCAFLHTLFVQLSPSYNSKLNTTIDFLTCVAIISTGFDIIWQVGP